MKRKTLCGFLALLVLTVVFRFVLLLAAHGWSLSAGRQGLSPFVIGGDDGDYYAGLAWQIADGQSPHAVNVYPYVLGQLMKWTGMRELFPYKVLNVLLGVAIVLFTLKFFFYLARKNRPENAEAGIGVAVGALVLLVGAYPSAILNETISLYRDAWIYAFHLFGAYCGLRMFHARSLAGKAAWAALFAGDAVCLYQFRWYATASLILCVCLWIAIRMAGRFKHPKAVLAALVTLIVAVGGWYVNRHFSEISIGNRPLEGLLEFRGGYEGRGGSNLGINLQAAPVYQVPFLFLYSFVSNVLGPLPWQVHGVTTLLVFVTEVPLLLIVVRMIWKNRRFLDANLQYLLLQAGVWFALISFFNDNLGTAVRLRVPGWHLLFLVHALLLLRARSATSLGRVILGESTERESGVCRQHLLEHGGLSDSADPLASGQRI